MGSSIACCSLDLDYSPKTYVEVDLFCYWEVVRILKGGACRRNWVIQGLPSKGDPWIPAPSSRLLFLILSGQKVHNFVPPMFPL